ncbi:hypothetical protein TNCV_1369921 [Trichonephila clavipes]|nr:hypothetical protein TNCV_1369921 [Trichonephila clavipes]
MYCFLNGIGKQNGRKVFEYCSENQCFDSTSNPGVVAKWLWPRTRGRRIMSLSPSAAGDPPCRTADAHKICRSLKLSQWRGGEARRGGRPLHLTVV